MYWCCSGSADPHASPECDSGGLQRQAPGLLVPSTLRLSPQFCPLPGLHAHAHDCQPAQGKWKTEGSFVVSHPVWLTECVVPSLQEMDIPFTAVHDSYWCHASNVSLFGCRGTQRLRAGHSAQVLCCSSCSSLCAIGGDHEFHASQLLC